jgi:diacylglycerol kinase family enzyme
MGLEPFYWGDDVFVDDGCVDLFVIRGKTFFDFLSMMGSVLWFIKRRSPLLMHIQAHRRIRFDTERPQPVQIDGDLIGMTPVEIKVLPAVLKIVVPKS